MRTCTLAFVGFCFFCGSLAVAEEPAIEHLVQALLNSGDRKISTGEFQYTLKVQEETPTPEMVATQVEIIRGALREQLKMHKGNPKMESVFQNAIDSAQEDVAHQIINNANLQYRIDFALNGLEIGGERYMEMARFDRATNEYQDPQLLLMRSQSDSSGTTINSEPVHGGMVIVGDPVHLPSQEPHRLGRAHGTLPAMTADMTASEIHEKLSKQIANLQVEKLADESNVETVKLTFQLRIEYPKEIAAFVMEPTFITVVYHVVPSRGYISPLVQEMDLNGTMIFEYVCADYFQTKDSELWYPGKCDYRGDVNNKPHHEDYVFSSGGVVLNGKIADERFTIPLVAGTPLIDARDGKNINYTASSDISLSIDDTEHLNQVQGIALSPPVLSPPVVQGKDQ